MKTNVQQISWKNPFGSIYRGLALFLLISGLTACGGGGSDNNNSNPNSEGNQTDGNMADKKKMVSNVVKHQTSLYATLKASAMTVKTNADSFCTAPDQTGLEKLRSGWKTTMLDWSRTRWIVSGPVGKKTRIYSIESWPLVSSDEVKTSVDNIVNGTAAISESSISGTPIQDGGLSALEYLLFNNGVTADTITPRQCQLITAISADLSTMLTEIDAEWGGYSKRLTEPSATDREIPTTNDAVDLLANQFLNLLVLIKDSKLSSPLGIDSATPAPARAEAWRSRYSLQVIKANLQSLHKIYKDEGNFGFNDLIISMDTNGTNTALAESINTQFMDLNNLLDTLISDGLTIYDNPTNSQMKTLYANVRTLEVEIKDKMFPAINAQVTFNFNDGD